MMLTTMTAAAARSLLQLRRNLHSGLLQMRMMAQSLLHLRGPMLIQMGLQPVRMSAESLLHKRLLNVKVLPRHLIESKQGQAERGQNTA